MIVKSIDAESRQSPEPIVRTIKERMASLKTKMLREQPYRRIVPNEDGVGFRVISQEAPVGESSGSSIEPSSRYLKATSSAERLISEVDRMKFSEYMQSVYNGRIPKRTAEVSDSNPYMLEKLNE